jgi:hypothetical protein
MNDTRGRAHGPWPDDYEADLAAWIETGVVQCSGETAPKVVKGRVVAGRRCKNFLPLRGSGGWRVGGDMPTAYCWVHFDPWEHYGPIPGRHP